MLNRLKAAFRGFASQHPLLSRALWAVPLAFILPALEERFLPGDSALPIDLLWIPVGLLTLYWLNRKRASGRVLLDIAPHPAQGPAVFMMTICLVAAALSLVGIWSESGGTWAVLSWLSGAAFFATLAFGRLEIREKGLWLIYQRVNWEKLESFSWGGEEGSTLMFPRRTLFGRPRTAEIKIPVERQAAVHEAIGQYFAKGESLPESGPPLSIGRSTDPRRS